MGLGSVLMSEYINLRQDVLALETHETKLGYLDVAIKYSWFVNLTLVKKGWGWRETGGSGCGG